MCWGGTEMKANDVKLLAVMALFILVCVVLIYYGHEEIVRGQCQYC